MTGRDSEKLNSGEVEERQTKRAVERTRPGGEGGKGRKHVCVCVSLFTVANNTILITTTRPAFLR